MSNFNVILYILDLFIYIITFSNFLFYNLQLHLFSLQIIHCENMFSAKGLSIDAKLLTAVGNTHLP